MAFKELAAKRYSCRKLSGKQVPQKLLNEIIDIALTAPTAVNKQPFKIFLMDSVKAKEIVHQVTTCTFGADTFLVVGYDSSLSWVRPFDNRNFADVDASIIATHIMLAVEDLGLATTWVGHFDAPLLKELCPAMKNYELIAIFPIGYAAEDGEPSPRHFIRKNKEELLEII